MTDTTHNAGRIEPVAIITPKPVTKYEASDGKTFNTELDAVAHETFLAVKGDLALNNLSDAISAVGRLNMGSADCSKVAYTVITALARKYCFVKRSAA